jgi:probable F420-dependent oxidoreductase
VKFDVAIFESDPVAAGERALALEACGFDGAFTFDGPHDPFLPLVGVASMTERLTLGTAVAIAFGRNPMICAQIGNDLQAASKGRFVLGLGAQVRAHVERRYGQAFSRPHARMREFVAAVRAIWRCWNEGAPLDFRGEMYRHTLMPPLFNPGPNPHGPPPIWLAGFGPRMITLVGEVADGWIIHPLHTPSFVEGVALPALRRGLELRGMSRSDVTVSCQTLVMMGRSDEEIARARSKARAQIAFYASTPTYRVVLEHHGWGGLQAELAGLVKENRWLEMIEKVGDDVLDAVGVSGRPGEICSKIRERNGFADRTTLVLYNEAEPDAVAEIVPPRRG